MTYDPRAALTAAIEADPTWASSLRSPHPRHEKGAKSAKTDETAGQRAMSVKPASGLVEGDPTRWLARHIVARGKINVLVGAEGIGKSLWWVLLVAHVTTGMACPRLGLPARCPGRVLLVITEDDWPDVRERLLCAGADLDHIRVLCEEDDGSGSPTFPHDLVHVYAEAEQASSEGQPLDLIVVDGWLDTVDSRLSVKDPQQARQALHPWHEVCAYTGAAALLIAHTNRLDTDNVRDLVGATSVLRQKARMLLFAASPPDTEATVYVGPDKANNATIAHAVSYAIESVVRRPVTDDDDGTTARLRITGGTGAPMGVHLAAWRRQAIEARKPPSADDRAWGWLREYLEDDGGTALVSDVKAAAAAAGHNPQRLASVLKAHGGTAGPAGEGEPWVYRLAPHE